MYIVCSESRSCQKLRGRKIQAKEAIADSITDGAKSTLGRRASKSQVRSKANYNLRGETLKYIYFAPLAKEAVEHETQLLQVEINIFGFALALQSPVRGDSEVQPFCMCTKWWQRMGGGGGGHLKLDNLALLSCSKISKLHPCSAGSAATDLLPPTQLAAGPLVLRKHLKITRCSASGKDPENFVHKFGVAVRTSKLEKDEAFLALELIAIVFCQIHLRAGPLSESLFFLAYHADKSLYTPD